MVYSSVILRVCLGTPVLMSTVNFSRTEDPPPWLGTLLEFFYSKFRVCRLA